MCGELRANPQGLALSPLSVHGRGLPAPVPGRIRAVGEADDYWGSRLWAASAAVKDTSNDCGIEHCTLAYTRKIPIIICVWDNLQGW